MKLYGAPVSCSNASRIALIESGFKFELVEFNLSDVNPKGYVPVLELGDGTILTGNVVVLQYIADLNPASGLAPPAGWLARYRLMEWLAFINSEVHRTFSNFCNPKLPDDMRPVIKERLDRHYG